MADSAELGILKRERPFAEPGIFSLLQPATLQYANSGSLANLYAVATALILNAVEGALLSKEQLPHRKSGSVALAFSNDGFAIGLTFLLKVFLLLRLYPCHAAHLIYQRSVLEKAVKLRPACHDANQLLLV